MRQGDYYKNMTDFIYQELAWGPTYKNKDGSHIKDTDNNSERYIKESLKKMKISLKNLKGMKIFNIGTGRESRFFSKYGAEVTHLDIGENTVKNLKLWAKKNKKKIYSSTSDIEKTDIGQNKFDLIFLAGIYQHIKKPAYALIKFLNSLKKNGLMYMGFYRSGEFKYFIVDAIRFLLNKKQLYEIRRLNSILFTLGEVNHYQSYRVMDDFFVPKKHNFHPRDIIHDIKLLGGKVFYFDKDLREYSHKGSEYFSIGGDRIYIKKISNKLFSKRDLKKKLKTVEGKNQIFDIQYRHKEIIQNIKLIKLIKKKYKENKIGSLDISSLCIGLYQFTRPMIFDQSEYYQKTKKIDRHRVINDYLKNFLKNFDNSKKDLKKFNKKLVNLGLKQT
jgi:hypothetical protein